MHGTTSFHYSPNLCYNMTLDDFFTFPEINNGLTVLCQVRELIYMMRENCDVNNLADSTRQRSAVASAIAATENKECLDLFLELDGLHFISNWLKDAQKFGNDSFRESITHLLGALERLQLDHEKLVTCDIWTSVENLLIHNNPEVRDKARVLLESWEIKRDIIDTDKMGGGTAVRRDRESFLENDSISREISVKNNGQELSRDFLVVYSNSDDFYPDRVESSRNANKILDPETDDEKPIGHVSPATSRQEFLYTRFDSNDLKSNMLEGQLFTSRSDDVVEMQDLTESGLRKKSNLGNENQRGSSNIIQEEGGDIKHHISATAVNSEKSWGRFISGIRDDSSDYGLAINYALDEKRADIRSGKKSDFEIEYGILDPLEVAMRVAMEVEREITYDREQSLSASEKLPENIRTQPESPDSVSGKKSDSSETENDSDSDSSEQSATSSDIFDTNGTRDNVETSKITQAAIIDLNEDLFLETRIGPENQFPAPISIASASRASPLRMPEINSSGGFDLNVREIDDESSVEINSERSENFELDLNRASGDDGALLDCRVGNLDLNVKASENFNISGDIDSISDDFAIINWEDFFVSETQSLQNSQTSEVAFDYNSGRTGNFMVIGPENLYLHSSAYGYSDTAPGPSGPLSGPIYEPEHHFSPYLLDYRGAPIVLYIVGSISDLPTAFSHPPVFVINVNDFTASDGVGPSWNGLDLNSGTLAENGSEDITRLGLFTNPAQDGPSSQATTTSSAVGWKRKEPDNGYNGNYYPCKHYTPRWN